MQNKKYSLKNIITCFLKMIFFRVNKLKNKLSLQLRTFMRIDKSPKGVTLFILCD